MISPDGSRKSTTNQPTSSRNDNQKLTVNPAYTSKILKTNEIKLINLYFVRWL